MSETLTQEQRDELLLKQFQMIEQMYVRLMKTEDMIGFILYNTPAAKEEHFMDSHNKPQTKMIPSNMLIAWQEHWEAKVEKQFQKAKDGKDGGNSGIQVVS